MCLELYGYKTFIFRCNLAGLFKTGWQGLLRLFKWCSATPPCVEGCTEPFKPTRKVLPALTLSIRSLRPSVRRPYAIVSVASHPRRKNQKARVGPAGQTGVCFGGSKIGKTFLAVRGATLQKYVPHYYPHYANDPHTYFMWNILELGSYFTKV